MTSYPVLEKINDPKDLRALDEKELPELVTELRQILVDTVSKTGAHHSSSLGALEISIA